MKFLKSKNLTLTMIFAMLYFGLTVIFTSASYEAVQFRVSEALTVLPIFNPAAIFGLTVGCFFSNIYGVFKNAVESSMPIDILIGSLATFLAAVLTNLIGTINSKKIKYLIGPLPAVLIKALVVGYEITFFNGEKFFYNFLNVGFGQFVVCYALGVPLMFFLYKNNAYKNIFN